MLGDHNAVANTSVLVFLLERAGTAQGEPDHPASI